MELWKHLYHHLNVHHSLVYTLAAALIFTICSLLNRAASHIPLRVLLVKQIQKRALNQVVL